MEQYRETKQTKETTHLMLNGGMLAIPPEKHEQFLRAYAADLCFPGRSPQFLVEKKTNPFFFFFELDFIGDHPLSDDEKGSLCSFIQKTIAACFTKRKVYAHQLKCAAYVADTKLMRDNRYKTGIHLIWRFPININSAWMLRRIVLNAIKAEMEKETATATETTTPSIPVPSVSWEDVLDPAVLKANGLRMVGSNKSEPCPKCKGGLCLGTAIACNTCSGTGKVDVGRPYYFFRLYNMDGTVDNAGSEELGFMDQEAAIRGSIRCVDATKAWVIDWDNAGVQKNMIEQQVQAERSSSSGNGKRPYTDTLDDMKALDGGEPAYLKLAEFINTNFPGSPVPTKITRCFPPKIEKTNGDRASLSRSLSGITTTSARPPCYFVNSNCKFCANVGGEHNSSKVYFIVYPSKAVQRCYSQKDVVRSFGNCPCNNFTSRPVTLPVELSKLLFPRSIGDPALREEGTNFYNEHADPKTSKTSAKRQRISKTPKPESPAVDNTTACPSSQPRISKTTTTAITSKDFFLYTKTKVFGL